MNSSKGVRAAGPGCRWNKTGARLVRSCCLWGGVFLLCLLANSVVSAQQPSPAVPLTIAQAVDDALRNYPSVQVSQEQVNAAAAEIRLARTAYLPAIDTVAQVNRSTSNNAFGLQLPQSVLPSITAPAAGTNNLSTAWGSAVGTLITWEPFDFGLRHANVNISSALKAQSQATLKRTQFEVAVATADAHLTLAAAEETVKAGQAAVDRSEVILRTTKALVAAELRPGADESRAEAELAAARTMLIQAQQAVETARANLARFTGLEPGQILIAAPRASDLPPEVPFAPPDPGVHPAAVEQVAVTAVAQDELRALERSYFPRFFVQGLASALGTGYGANGRPLGGANGLAPTVQNYAIGLTVTFGVMDRPAIEAREEQQLAIIRAESARSRQIATDLRAQWNVAVATVRGARAVAANVPVELAAAQAATRQASARYEAGLGTIDAVAEAQRLLTQAEIDNALARLGIWRGLLEVATAAGDLQPFLHEASQ